MLKTNTTSLFLKMKFQCSAGQYLVAICFPLYIHLFPTRFFKNNLAQDLVLKVPYFGPLFIKFYY